MPESIQPYFNCSDTSIYTNSSGCTSIISSPPSPCVPTSIPSLPPQARLFRGTCQPFDRVQAPHMYGMYFSIISFFKQFID